MPPPSAEAKSELLRRFAQPSPSVAFTSQLFVEKGLMLPEKLYQYRPPCDFSLSALEQQGVWVRSPLEFNDPFDSAFSVNLNMNEGFEAEAWRIFQEDGRRTVEESSQAISAIIQIAESRQRQLGSELVDAMRRTLKVACFSEVGDSLLMWGHYANAHRGFVVEYDLRGLWHELDKMFLRSLFPVAYGDTFSGLIRDWDFIHRPSEGSDIHFPVIAACHKASDWSYEREWRYIIGYGALAENGYCRTPAPNRVIIGARMCPEYKNNLLTVLERKGISSVTAAISHNSFQMSIPD
jgi:hypothetical protein